MKVCTRCQVEKDDSEFAFDKGRNRLRSHCRECAVLDNQEYYKRLSEKPKEHPKEKQCRECGLIKKIQEFGYIGPAQYYYPICKECQKKHARPSPKKPLSEQKQLKAQGKRRCKECAQIKFFQEFPCNRAICKECLGRDKQEKKRQKQAQRTSEKEERRKASKYNMHKAEQQALYAKGMKRCGHCGEELSLERFNKSYRREDSTGAYLSVCKVCIQKYDTGGYLRKRTRKGFVSWLLVYIHQDRQCSCCQKTKHISFFPLVEGHSAVCLCCRDGMYRVKKTIAGRIRETLGSTKTERAAYYLGCTFRDLYRHISSQFSPGMTWANYGEWHIDHYVPISHFSLDEMHICWNYRNLRPLWGAENIAKSNSLPVDYREKIQEIVDNLSLS